MTSRQIFTQRYVTPIGTSFEKNLNLEPAKCRQKIRGYQKRFLYKPGFQRQITCLIYSIATE